MKKIAILGASGSIGTSTLEVLRRHKDKFMLVAFSVYSKSELISEVLDEFKDVSELKAYRRELMSSLRLTYISDPKQYKL